MSCRQKIRQMQDARGGATSDEEVCLPENSFVVDDDGRVVFADIVLDSLEEETTEYLEAICVNNIRKINGRFKCALCPFRSFCRLRQLRDHVLRHEADEDYLGPSLRRLCAENSRRQLPLEKLFDPAKRCGAASSL